MKCVFFEGVLYMYAVAVTWGEIIFKEAVREDQLRQTFTERGDMQKNWIGMVLSGIALLVLIACGVSRQGTPVSVPDGDGLIASTIDELNAQYAAHPEYYKKIVERDIDMKMVLEGKRLVLSLQLKKGGSDSAGDEPRGDSSLVHAVETFLVNFLKVRKHNGGPEEEYAVTDFLDQLCKKEIDFVILSKNDQGMLLAETTLDRNQVKQVVQARKKTEDAERVFYANIAFASFTDPRNNRTYKIGTILGETWLADDLVSAAGENLYSWKDAQEACPEGWRLPSADELNGARFKKFKGSYTIMQKHVFWSSTVKETPDGKVAVAVPYKGWNEKYYDNDETVDFPMDQANLSSNKQLVRCIKR